MIQHYSALYCSILQSSTNRDSQKVRDKKGHDTKSCTVRYPPVHMRLNPTDLSLCESARQNTTEHNRVHHTQHLVLPSFAPLVSAFDCWRTRLGRGGIANSEYEREAETCLGSAPLRETQLKSAQPNIDEQLGLCKGTLVAQLPRTLDDSMIAGLARS